MNMHQTKDLLLMLAGMYPQMPRNVSADTIKGYHMMLADIPQEALFDRMPTILSRHPTFPPTAPELRNAVVEAATAIPDGEQAWAEVMRQVKNRGMWHGLDPESDPTLMRAVKAVGWEQICMCDRDKLGYERDAFLRFYGSMRSKELEFASHQGLSAGRSSIQAGGSDGVGDTQNRKIRHRERTKEIDSMCTPTLVPATAIQFATDRFLAVTHQSAKEE